MSSRMMKRREFLKLSATALAGAAVAACGGTPTPVPATQAPEAPKATDVPKATEPSAPAATAVPPSGYVEPPMLAAKVSAGELPPIGERLPENPYVVSGKQVVGAYGGEIRMSMSDYVWFESAYDLNSDRLLQYSDADYRTIYSHVLESYEVTPDGKAWTFHMRKGLKWSDGEPLNTEDIRFWWEDIELDTEIRGSPDWQWRFGGENMKVDIVDDFTFKFTFPVSFGTLAGHMTRFHNNSWAGPFYPSHFLKMYHKKYADAAFLDAEIAAQKVDGWAALFNVWIGWGMAMWQAPKVGTKSAMDYPVCNAWHLVGMPQDGLLLWERNPYYWKVDVEGNQLPYVDTMRYDYVANVEALKLKMAQGELDIAGQHIVTVADYPFYKENEATSNYNVADLSSCMGDRYVFFPQHYVNKEDGTPDEGWNDLIQNHPEFVQALSVAIDRDEINESKFYGLAQVGQLCPHPTSSYYKPEYGTAFAAYDPDQANELLDSIGCTKGADGKRLRPDGQPLQILIEHAGIRIGPSAPEITEMISTYWNAIGVETVSKEVQESLYNERMNNSLVQVAVWHADRCTDMLLPLQPQWYIPTADGAQGGCCSAWTRWYQAADKTTEGLIEPPQWMKDLYDYFDQASSVVSDSERVALMQKIFDYLAQRPLEIGLVQSGPAPLLFNKNFRNLPPAGAPVGWDTYGLSMYHPEAFYFEGGVRFEV